jgi:peptidoglycan/LPS O-acetylase OafA/YrhL
MPAVRQQGSEKRSQSPEIGLLWTFPYCAVGDSEFQRLAMGFPTNQRNIAERAPCKTASGQQSTRSVEQLTSLTPLRGIAACWVMVTHFANSLPSIQHGGYTGAVSKGHLAVDLFFILSGFVITHVYSRGFTRRVTARQYQNFLKARVARLYPLHLAVLLLFVAAVMAERAATYCSTARSIRYPSSGSVR